MAVAPGSGPWPLPPSLGGAAHLGVGSRWLLGTCPRELRPWPPRRPRITPAPALRQPGPFSCRAGGPPAPLALRRQLAQRSQRWRSLLKSGGTVLVGRRHAAPRSWRSMNVRKREAAPWGLWRPVGYWQLPTNVNVTPARGQPPGAAACPRLFPQRSTGSLRRRVRHLNCRPRAHGGWRRRS